MKVRGYRIELGEIETALREHDSVSAAVATVHRGPGGEDRLLAYVVPRSGSSLQPGALRKQVRSRLPEYMVPSVFVPLETLPLTPNGKVDRRALPEPVELHVAVSSSRVEPRTRSERLLAEIWSRALDVKSVGAHDNFFDLGGHSLLSMRVILDVERERGAASARERCCSRTWSRSLRPSTACRRLRSAVLVAASPPPAVSRGARTGRARSFASSRSPGRREYALHTRPRPTNPGGGTRAASSPRGTTHGS